MFIMVVCSLSFALLTVMVANWACTYEANLVYFAKISAVASSVLQVRASVFRPTKILSSRTKPQKRCRPTSNQDNFLWSLKSSSFSIFTA